MFGQARQDDWPAGLCRSQHNDTSNQPNNELAESRTGMFASSSPHDDRH